MTAADRPAGAPRSPAKLELLVRRDDDEGFEVQEISSRTAWIRMRPQHVPDDRWELADFTSTVDRSTGHILRNTQTDRYLLLSERERFLWDRMTGRNSVQDLATAYVIRYGEFDFDIIPALIRKLQRARLIELKAPETVREKLADRRGKQRMYHAVEQSLLVLERVHVASQQVHATFVRLYRWGGFLLFTRAALFLCVLLGIAGLAAGARLWHEADVIARGLGGHPVLALLAVKLAFVLTVAVHQVVHGLALVHYRRRVREFGFTFLHGIVPTFFVDVTDIFMASRRARVVTAASGTIVHLVIGSLCFLLADRLSPGFAQAFIAASGMLQWQAFVVALYPFCFIEMDGYHILVDVLGVPTLKQDALAYAGGLLRGRVLAPWSRETAVWLGYVVLSTVSVGAFIAFNILLIVNATS